jgi:hypothetical protein
VPPGTYKAWLADDQGAPATTFKQHQFSYVRSDRKTVATSWSDLTDGQLLNPISTTELGTVLSTAYPFVWTRAKIDGTLDTGNTHDCSDWTSDYFRERGLVGQYDKTNNGWTNCFGYCNARSRVCASKLPLYCFQQ